MSRQTLSILVFLVALGAIGGLFYFRNAAPQKVHTVGVIEYLDVMAPTYTGFKEKMAKLGYTEGKNISYEYRQANGSFDALDQASREFIGKNVDIIFATALEAALSAKKETEAAGRTDIPVVFANANNPDELGLIASFKSSGNNLTGVATDFSNVTAKKLEFLRQINPAIKKIGVFDAKITDPAGQFMLAELKKQAARLGMEVVLFPLVSPPTEASTAEMAKVIAEMKPGAMDAYFHLPGPLLNIPPNIPFNLQVQNKLKVPGVYLVPQMVEAGGVMSYQHSFSRVGAQAALYADKILRGAKPSELPIEYQDKNDLVVNPKAAQSIGLDLPQSLIGIADQVIQ
ncbi:hypothetical protein A3D66_03175 [Candidatus Kaiserbacteria bacterium RIFCSPHIGHO2_02_FULL_50_9]|nr:MAG: hypothetical protein A3D66_03175 [Candidatus Kaiserbacteria bacterium RIFCSPHIGHO2_02_FULL_50_9]